MAFVPIGPGYPVTHSDDLQRSLILRARHILQMAADESLAWSNADEAFKNIVSITEELRLIRKAIVATPTQDRGEGRESSRFNGTYGPDLTATRRDLEVMDAALTTLRPVILDENLFYRSMAPNKKNDAAAQEARLLIEAIPLDILEVAANLMLISKRNRCSVNIRRDGFEFRSASTGLYAAT